LIIVIFIIRRHKKDGIKKTTKKCWAICLYVPYCWCR